MYSKLITDKIEALKGLSVELNGIRAKYDGKPGDMTALEEERFDKALNDYSALETEIKTLKERDSKLGTLDKFEDTASNALEVQGNVAKPEAYAKDALRRLARHFGQDRRTAANSTSTHSRRSLTTSRWLTLPRAASR